MASSNLEKNTSKITSVIVFSAPQSRRSAFINLGHGPFGAQKVPYFANTFPSKENLKALSESSLIPKLGIASIVSNGYADATRALSLAR